MTNNTLYAQLRRQPQVNPFPLLVYLVPMTMAFLGLLWQDALLTMLAGLCAAGLSVSMLLWLFLMSRRAALEQATDACADAIAVGEVDAIRAGAQQERNRVFRAFVWQLPIMLGIVALFWLPARLLGPAASMMMSTTMPALLALMVAITSAWMGYLLTSVRAVRILERACTQRECSRS